MGKKQSFEQMLKRLEEIVEKLESTQLPLEKSLALFQEGKDLSDQCLKKLTEIEQKVSKLIDKKDTVELVPFPEQEQTDTAIPEDDSQ